MGLTNDWIRVANSRLWSHHPEDGFVYAGRCALVALAYYFAARISLNFSILPGIVSPLWPPAAIALCACLAWGSRMAPAIGLGSLAAMLPSELPLPVSAMASLGSTLEPCAAAYLIRRTYRSRTGFIYRGPVFSFIGIVLLCGMLAATIGTIALVLPSPAPPVDAALTWMTWWLGDITGMIIGVPLLLAGNVRRHMHWHARNLAEIAAFALLLATVTLTIFGGAFDHLPVAFLTIPFIVWAALRFNFAVVNWAVAATCAVALWNTRNGMGPFAAGDRADALVLLMIYMVVVGTTGLSLGSLVHQRRKADLALRAERDSLERRVDERTEALRADIEARKRVERQLADAQRLARVGSWVWNLETDDISWSEELYRIYGFDPDNSVITQEKFDQRVHPEDRERLRTTLAQCTRDGATFQIEHRIVLPDGMIRHVFARGQAQADDNGQIRLLSGTAQDVTDERLAEAALRDAEERYRKVVELSPDAVFVLQDGAFVFANPAAVAMLGAQDSSQIVGRQLFDFLHEDFHAVAMEGIERLRQGGHPPSADKKLVRLDGTVVDVEVNASPFVHEGRFAALYILRDITERKKNLEQMAYLAHYDSLTGLPNRTLFMQRLEHALDIAERPGRSLELLFLDLDHFKQINDTLGHAAGDMVLQETARRLQSTLRESDTVARLAGDEFVVLVENVDEPQRGGIIAEKILAAFTPPFMPLGEPLTVGTSIGISSFPSDGTDAKTLLKSADTAMYNAKTMGRNTYRYYSTEMNRDNDERTQLENALRLAIERNQLSLHYQPRIDVLTNRIAGMEALLRWQHPTLGAVAPRKFIPLAENAGLINAIGYWTIRAACRQNKQWQDSHPARLKVSVNLSPRQLMDDKLLDAIEEILTDTGLDPQYLELEIAESAAMSNPEKTVRVLRDLNDMGVSVAIDNFGTGYSSLASLKHFPIRSVKIDHSFVQGIAVSREDAAVAKAIINLAHSLDCSVTAEGTETQQQYDFLREHECDSVQGYYFSAPMPADMFGDLIKVQSNLYLH